MALAEICGINQRNPLFEEANIQSDIVKYSNNFINNLDLALPPFPNVSIFYLIKTKCTT